MTTTETLKQMLDVFTGSVAALERLGWTGNDEYRAEAEKRKREVAALTDALRALEQEPKLIELAAVLKRTQDDLRRENWQLDEQVLKWQQRAEQAEAEVMRLRAELAEQKRIVGEAMVSLSQPPDQKLQAELKQWRGYASFLAVHGIVVPKP